MSSELAGAVALVTGASSGIGAQTARHLAEKGATVAVVARRADRLDSLVADISRSGGSAFAVPADITEREQAEAAVARVVEHLGRLDILVNNAGLMLLGPVDGADPDEWDRMLDINVRGLLYVTRAALPHLLTAAGDSARRVADIVNVGSIAGRQATGYVAAYNATKFAVTGFTEALRQEVTERHVRVGVVEPGATNTELPTHNNEVVRANMLDPYVEQHEVLQPDDIADAISYIVTRPRHTAVRELLVTPTDQA
ncbi:SDR family NAD(P)-dependent oxidoreductase [Williamsia sp. M5A3_1d]